MGIAGRMIGGIHPTLQRLQRPGSVKFCGFLTPNDGVRNDRVVGRVRNDREGDWNNEYRITNVECRSVMVKGACLWLRDGRY